MSGEITDPDREAMVREKKRAAASSVLAGLFLTVIKLVAGLTTGSLGLMAEAAHSALDFGAAAMTFFAVRSSWRPPDAEHHYGHGKVENLTALGEALLLVATSIWILVEAAERFMGRGPEVEPSVWAFGVIGISIVVDVVRSRDLKRVAKKSGSQALEADALHFSTDIGSSAVVMGGLVCVVVARKLDVSWLAMADPVAASIVAIIVLVLSVRLGRRAVDMLLDQAPPGLAERIAERLSRLEGLAAAPQVRVRQAGDQVFADVELPLHRGLPIAEGDRLAEQARQRICEVAGRYAVVMVQLAAEQPQDASLHDRLATAVGMEGVRAHDITIRRNGEVSHADFHLELPDDMTLGEGHAIADRVEKRLEQELPEIGRVDIHLELHEHAPEPASALPPGEEARLRNQVCEVARRVCKTSRAHSILISETKAGLCISMHCVFPPSMRLAEAHSITDELERAVRQAIPGVARVAVHAEPGIA